MLSYDWPRIAGQNILPLQQRPCDSAVATSVIINGAVRLLHCHSIRQAAKRGENGVAKRGASRRTHQRALFVGAAQSDSPTTRSMIDISQIARTRLMLFLHLHHGERDARDVSHDHENQNSGLEDTYGAMSGLFRRCIRRTSLPQGVTTSPLRNGGWQR